MAAPKGLIVKTPHGYEIRARRRLEDADTFDKFFEELQTKLEAEQESSGTVSIPDIDLSQNKLSLEQFESVFNLLAMCGAHVRRFRLFGCPTLDDEVMRMFCDFFRADLTADRAPREIHLSDCAITTDGFNQLMIALEDCDLYPLAHGKTGKPEALYLRLENNYIDEGTIQQKVDEGFVKPLKKEFNKPMPAADEGVKVHLVVKDPASGTFQQQVGEPPAPEDAPPPKQVKDYNWQEQQRAKQQWPALAAPGGKASGGKGQPWQQRHPWQAGGNGKGGAARGPSTLQPPGAAGGPIRALRPVQAAPAAVDRSRTPAARAATPNTWVLPGQAGASKPTQQLRPGTQQVIGRLGGALRPAGVARGSVGAVRAGGAARPTQPKGPPPKARLPKGWEEVWSEEYKIPYYWKAATGESMWDRPTA